jgi:hypothetical protein
VVVSFLAACNVTSSLGGSNTTPSGGTSQAGQSASSSSSPSPSGDSSGGGMSSNERAPMINLMGKTPDEAKAALRAAGFTGEVEVNRIALECVDAKEVPGQINCQNPDVGKLHYRHAAVNVHVYEAQTHTGRITRDQLMKAVGMTVDDAKKYLRSVGHVGQVDVREDTVHFHKGCAKDRVCDVGPAGVGVEGLVTLVLNKRSVDITLPD